MNTSQIKNFATQSRNILKTGVIQRIQILGFDANGNLTKGEPTRIDIQGGATLFAGEIYDGAFYDRWMALRRRVQEKGVKEVYEEAAYTWFNRLVAIRIMMKNGFIDPVLAYTYEQTRIPRIVAEARAGRVGQMSAADREKLRELMGDDSRINEQFALLIDNFCRTNPVIFNCFGGIEEYISLLLPDNILAPGGFIELLNHTNYITDEDFKQSELIGWLYQFYISEKKDEVFDGFKKGKKAEAEDIPAATQIFTPNWIVKYMVQNTIGRIYLDNNPWATGIKEQMKYLVEPAEPTPKDAILKLESLEDYSLIDPACGSGHILIEGFELFFKMYLEEGYSSHNAIENILRKNLLGIDLDTRAKQLATFALLMTAAKIDRSFLDCKVMPRVLDMPGHTFSRPLYELLREFYMGEDRTVMEETMKAFELLEQAENLGSVMKFDLSSKARREMALRYKEWMEVCAAKQSKESFVYQILPSIFLILTLTDKYSSVVANPPYMGSNSYNSELSAYISRRYSIAKYDLCTVFLVRFAELCKENAPYAFIIPPSWMFLSSFEALRGDILRKKTIYSMLHLSNGVFGGDFGSSCCVMRNRVPEKEKGTYYRIVDKTFQFIDSNDLKKLFEAALVNPSIKFDFKSYSVSEGLDLSDPNKGAQIVFRNVSQVEFEKIPGQPIGYWAKPSFISLFSEKDSIDAYAIARSGLSTGDNKKYFRFWFEPSLENIAFECDSNEEYIRTGKKFVPCTQGGNYRRWYGNLDSVIDWTDPDSMHRPRTTYMDLYYRPGISWNAITSTRFSSRYYGKGFLFEHASCSLFPQNGLSPYFILSFLNSPVENYIMNILNPTINSGADVISEMPLIIEHNEVIEHLGKANVEISRLDWNTRESSWEFKENELLRIYKENHGGNSNFDANRLEDIVVIYKEYWAEQFNKLHANEEELNRQFIEIYGLQDELTPDIPLDEITILQQGEISVENEQLVWHNDVLAKQLLSYAIGCMMGRYRLDRPGLHIAYPNPSSEDIEAYDFQGEKFEIDDDGVIPLLSRDCPFDDNAYNRVVRFIRQVFGESFLNENLNFIESALGKTIENYFAKDFWKDHKKMYSNRPIYWLFSSRRGAFQCLTYMHRMNPYTAEVVRSKYLLPYIDFLKNKIAADMDRASSLSTVERKNLDKMQVALDECLEYEERLHDVADRQIRFDLDDGVVKNYALFGDVLAPIR